LAELETMRRCLPLLLLVLLLRLANAAEGGAYIEQIGAQQPRAGPAILRHQPPPTASSTPKIPDERSDAGVAVDRAGNAVDWMRNGNEIQLEVAQTGTGNTIAARQSGAFQHMSVSQFGNGNYVSATQSGASNSIIVLQR
jgi:hypothetical protein